jgi:hypothetical protein
LLLSLANSATKPAVLTHRPGEVSLDNAFSLIEGHPAPVVSPFGLFAAHEFH